MVPMDETNNQTKTHPEKSWYVYIVQCYDSTLYTGITTDLARRVSEHNSSKKGAKYTRNRQPVILVYQETVPTRAAAASREYTIKKMTATIKKKLIASRVTCGK